MREPQNENNEYQDIDKFTSKQKQTDIVIKADNKIFIHETV